MIIEYQEYYKSPLLLLLRKTKTDNVISGGACAVCVRARRVYAVYLPILGGATR